MLTIFSCPKPFAERHLNIIQRNAIKSWTRLKPRPEIILVGDEEGVAEVCKEFCLHHVPRVERNQSGTPLVSSVFAEGQKAARNDLVCYINADVILLQEFAEALEKITATLKAPFLLCGRRCELRLDKEIEFDGEWDREIKITAQRWGRLASPSAIDYFVFQRGLIGGIPTLAIGRFRFDNWLVYHCASRRITIVDLTPANLVIHQSHNYGHVSEVGRFLEGSTERLENERRIGTWWPLMMFTTWDADYVLTARGHLIRPSRLRRWVARSERAQGVIGVWLRSWYPMSAPILALGKVAGLAANRARHLIYRRA